jgi:hypothetical protein
MSASNEDCTYHGSTRVTGVGLIGQLMLQYYQDDKYLSNDISSENTDSAEGSVFRSYAYDSGVYSLDCLLVDFSE